MDAIADVAVVAVAVVTVVDADPVAVVAVIDVSGVVVPCVWFEQSYYWMTNKNITLIAFTILHTKPIACDPYKTELMCAIFNINIRKHTIEAPADGAFKWNDEF